MKECWCLSVPDISIYVLLLDLKLYWFFGCYHCNVMIMDVFFLPAILNIFEATFYMLPCNKKLVGCKIPQEICSIILFDVCFCQWLGFLICINADHDFHVYMLAGMDLKDLEKLETRNNESARHSNYSCSKTQL